ncbi:c-type cytochrome [Nitrosophilus alvini]|uniref:c-type cytochrome n=1 Tax=Nitrosophilus alvini TaxID=2714855 RepID=UPI001F2B2678|nr:c-type cytochrome [Nitrosophilus alvini]
MRKILFILTAAAMLLISGCGEKKEEKTKEADRVETKSVQTLKPETVKSETAENEPVAEETEKKVEVNAQTEQVLEKIEEKAKETESAIDGAKLFVKCAGCHGVHGEKKALGKSQVIKGWPKDKTVEALKGYKKGTYGGSMKSLMKGQVVMLSDEEIEALADYISKLK